MCAFAKLSTLIDVALRYLNVSCLVDILSSINCLLSTITLLLLFFFTPQKWLKFFSKTNRFDTYAFFLFLFNLFFFLFILNVVHYLHLKTSSPQCLCRSFCYVSLFLYVFHVKTGIANKLCSCAVWSRWYSSLQNDENIKSFETFKGHG